VVLKANGQPVAGAQVRFSTTLGTIDPVETTNNSGVAEATLRGDGRLGTAKVSVTTGAVKAPDPIEVTIGAAAKLITLQATPAIIPANGGKVTLLAILRDGRGLPLAGQGINFTTELGKLASGGRILITDANGQVQDTLTVTETDLSNNQTSLTVTAHAVAGDGTALTADFPIQVQSQRPVAKFAFAKGQNANDVVFTDQSTGAGTLTYSWNFGDGTSAQTAVVTHTYASAGTYTVVETVTSSTGLSDTATGQITVPVTSGGTIQ
jgi:PKD repeat protein